MGRHKDAYHTTSDLSMQSIIDVRLLRVELVPARAVRRVEAGEPAGEAVEPGEEQPLGDVCLVELVAHLPFQLGGHDHAAYEPRRGGQAGVEPQRRVGGAGEQGVLVYDPLGERRGLEEEGE